MCGEQPKNGTAPGGANRVGSAAGAALLALMGYEGAESAVDYPARREQELNRLADMVGEHLDQTWLNDMFGIGSMGASA